MLLSNAARRMKISSENHSGHVNNHSGPGALFIHFPPESLFTSARNLYSHHSGTLIHIARNTQGSDRQFTLQGPERRFDFGELDVFLPEFGG